MLFEHHSHTTLCNHAFGEPEEYVEGALASGLSGLTVTCHNPMPNDFAARVRMRMDEFPAYLMLVERARAHAEKVGLGADAVRLGLECDFFPGYESFLEEQANWGNFDYLLVSVHPTTPEYKERYGDPREHPAVSNEQAWRTYFDMLAASAELGIHDCLSHPDLIKNPTRAGWDAERAVAMACEPGGALDRIAATGKAMELNTSGLKKLVPEMNPGPLFHKAMRERGIPVVIGADAHRPGRVGDRFPEALGMLRDAGYETVRQFRQREAYDVSIADALAHFAAHAAKS